MRAERYIEEYPVVLCLSLLFSLAMKASRSASKASQRTLRNRRMFGSATIFAIVYSSTRTGLAFPELP